MLFPLHASVRFINKLKTKITVRLTKSNDNDMHIPGPKVIKPFSCSTHLSIKFSLLINIRVIAIFIFISRENITKTRLFKYTENFTSKTENFQIKNCDIFQIPAQNIDCGYLLELPH